MKNVEKCWLALGGNQGDRLKMLRDSLQLLEDGGFMTEAISRVFETPPWGLEEQPAFLNLCLRGRWAGSPEALLHLAQQTEQALGRVREVKWGPRLIDIDILLFGARQIHTGELQVPHPWMGQRAFVLAPLADIDPELVIPGETETVAALLSALPEADKAGLAPLPAPLR